MKKLRCLNLKTVNGVEPSRAQIYIETHKDRKTRDKKKIDEESAKAVALMKEKLADLPEGVEQMEGKIAWKGDIYDQVIGKDEYRGRVRGLGGGVCASKLWGQSIANPRSESVETNISNELVHKLLNDVKCMQQKMDFMQEKHTEELRSFEEKRDMELKEIRDTQTRIESHMSQLLQLCIQRQSTNNSNSASNETRSHLI